MTVLDFDVYVSGMTPVPSAALKLPNGEAGSWSPLAHTLIHGRTEAALVEPPITRGQAHALGDWIEGFGKRLSFIYITHGHGDHWLGTQPLVERFEGVTVHATPGTIEAVRQVAREGPATGLWPAAFPGRIAEAPLSLLPAPEDGFQVDGHVLMPVEVGHSDTDDSTVLHVPSIGLVAAGDVVYNNVHQYLGECLDGGLKAWRRALDTVESLDPAHVVAGHQDQQRGDNPSDIAETRRYLDDAERLLATRPDRGTYFDEMIRLYPERINPLTVWMSARMLPARTG
ncbi:MBL fold metallo-hydrolase [Streptomyces sp. TS71-3]|uniref:MBL fold metallo-hydrolase n=1 Tax=Streptomyces sp. TS71-3 TaxID=2733862 RepID=UPI001B263B80|nr:MBL fold metallo-hydrolase [Streptomyces sp. TS71-3]GHJ39430.1 MBL fold metallo-hydrolase [Streptomyces sp. TS71-3]